MSTTEIFHDPHAYGDMDTWRSQALELHAQGPIHRAEPEGFRPFWIVIGNDEVMEIERNPDVFTNAPQPVLENIEIYEARRAQGAEIRTLIHMDAPDHTGYRKLTNDWFKPASVKRLQGRLDDLATEAMDKFRAGNGELDFNKDIAIAYPLQVILAILGLPETDYSRMLKLTQELFGAQDPDLQRADLTPEEAGAVVLDFYQYFTGLSGERRENPTDDLASLIANGTIDGEPLPDLETMGYYVIIATAGHDTTAAAMSEGMMRLASDREQFELLKANPDLMTNAVAEMIRLATPVRHFMREAQQDAVIGGQAISKGDWLMLNYTAANIDPRMFDNPTAFDIRRKNADRHIAFGFGTHFCLGAQLARLELRTLFREVMKTVDSVELAGDVSSAKTTFVGGIKTLPIRYALAD